MSGNRKVVGQFYPRWGEVWQEDHDEPYYDSEELQRSWKRAVCVYQRQNRPLMLIFVAFWQCEVMVCVLTWVSGVIASSKNEICGVWYRARLLVTDILFIFDTILNPFLPSLNQVLPVAHSNT